VSDVPTGPCQLCIQDGATAKASCVLLSAEERHAKRGKSLCAVFLIAVKRTEGTEGDVVAERKEGEAAANSLLRLAQPSNSHRQLIKPR